MSISVNASSPLHRADAQQAVLRIENLATHYTRRGHSVRALDDLSLEVAAGETLAVVGESGSGKTALGLSIMGLLPKPAGRIAAGRVLLNGENLITLEESAMRAVRGNRISMIFQEPMTALNPVLSIERQIGEVMRVHRGSSKHEARDLALEMLRVVRIPDAARTMKSYPHQLSGGMRQRVMIAAALACQPALLIADEPTTALDVTIQAEILDLIAELQSRLGTAVMFISHDLGVVSSVADRVLVLYAGRKVEEAPAQSLFARPLHPYTRALLAALPGSGVWAPRGSRRLPELPPTTVDPTTIRVGCAFAPRCGEATERCLREVPVLTNAEAGHTVACWNWDRIGGVGLVTPRLSEPVFSAPVSTATSPTSTTISGSAAYLPGTRPVLEVNNLDVVYRTSHMWSSASSVVRAVQDVSFQIAYGETLALVGESGCGKTSVARAVLGLVPPGSGGIRMLDTQTDAAPARGANAARRDVQIVFQDPFGSLNPRLRVGDAIAEPLKMFKLVPASAREQRVRELLEQVGLRHEDGRKYPHEFSGGQRQRIALARALAADPRLVVCDEPTSALDVSVQAQVLNLLAEIQEQRGIAYLFISHDLALVRHFAHRVAVMYFGRIVEIAPADELFLHPLHPYTVALLAAVPRVGVRVRPGERERLKGEPPSASDPPTGCAFHMRCPKAIVECRLLTPELRQITPGHFVACHVADADALGA